MIDSKKIDVDSTVALTFRYCFTSCFTATVQELTESSQRRFLPTPVLPELCPTWAEVAEFMGSPSCKSFGVLPSDIHCPAVHCPHTFRPSRRPIWSQKRQRATRGASYNGTIPVDLHESFGYEVYYGFGYCIWIIKNKRDTLLDFDLFSSSTKFVYELQVFFFCTIYWDS